MSLDKQKILDDLYALLDANKLSQARYAIEHITAQIISGRYDIPVSDQVAKS